MKVAMLGTGYVGLVAGVCFADAGNEVTCVDSNPEKINSLTDRQLPFYEPGLNDLFQRNFDRMTFTHDIGTAVKKADVIFVAVGTPEKPDGSADMSFTYNVLKEVCEAADAPKRVVLKSTVPIGTAKEAQSFCDQQAKHKLEIINNPEFLRQGEAVQDFLHPDRVVIGCQTEEARDVMFKLYKPFLKKAEHFICMDNTSAEMTKYAANSFLAMKISFINELSLLADKLGANVKAVREGFTSDNRINPSFFSPGIGYGGSCFPKDVRALIHTAEAQGLNLMLLKATDEVNERQKTILAERLHERLGDLKGLKIALWGLSFKPRTDDVRRAPSLKLIKDLVDRGATVAAYDPVAGANAKRDCEVEFELSPSPMDAAKDADALVLVTEWNEFKAPDFKELKSRLKNPLIFDGRNLYDRQQMEKEGFEYVGIGQ